MKDGSSLADGVKASMIAVLLSACGPESAPPKPDTEPSGAVESPCNEGEDTDGDGLDDCTEAKWRTSPVVADTDGDGYSDFDEVVNKAFDPEVDNYQFNPLIADLPRIEVTLGSVPNIALIYDEAEVTGQRLSTSHGQSSSEGVSSVRGGSSSTSVEQTHTGSITIGAEVSASPSVNVEIGYEYSHATTNETSANWSQEQTAENARTFEQAEELEQSAEVHFTGGELSVTVNVENPGHISYELRQLTLTAFVQDPRAPTELSPIGTLTFLSEGNSAVFPSTVLEPGARNEGLVFSTDLSVADAKALLRDSKNLVVRPATYSLTAGERTFGLERTEVNARTAEVIIDLGATRPLEAYRVAIAHFQGLSAAEVLRDLLAVDFEIGVGSWRDSVNGREYPTEEGLVLLRDATMDSALGRYILGVHSVKEARGSQRSARAYNLLLESYSLDDIILRAGDVLHLSLIEDKDFDGLGERVERTLGSDPTLADTDGDGLTDLEEFAGWVYPCTNSENAWVYPSPLAQDSDGDGLDDRSERDLCSNPSSGH